MNKTIVCGLIALLVITGAVSAEQKRAGTTAQQKEFQSLDEQVQTLKEDVLKINHELMLLQEKLLYPSSTQAAVFVSIEPNPKFSLDSIELRLDKKVVGKHIYTYRELQALQQGGVQRLHTTNLTTGTHQLAVIIAGTAGGNKAFKSNAGFAIKKAAGPKLVELKVVKTGSSKPSIVMKDWK